MKYVYSFLSLLLILCGCSAQLFVYYIYIYYCVDVLNNVCTFARYGQGRNDMDPYVLNKLYGKEYPENAVKLESAVSDVFECIRNTVIQKRGNQCMLLGARATGKSLVVHQALDMALKQFPDQFLVVKINGIIQNEDRLALREIAKQLDRQINTADEPIEKPSMNLTLKSLNVLFNVDVEEDDESGMQIEEAKFNQEDGSTRPKSVVFIVDEFERYTINHQVLAYELLDWCQASLAGVAVIGLSARMNMMDLLEKRNRSRNTAKVITLGKPSTQQDLEAIGKELLRPNSIDDHDTKANEEYYSRFPLQQLAEQVYYTSNSVRHLASLLQPYALGISPFTNQQFTSEHMLVPLESMPELDLALIVCAARAVIRYDTSAVNLVIVLDEWRTLANATHTSRFQMAPDAKSLPKPGSTPSSHRAIRYAWESLREMGLLEPTASQGAQEDLKMFIPELDIEDIRSILPRNHTLYEWTSL